MFAVSFSIISITTGIFLNYTYAFGQLGPASIWTWPIAAVGQTLVVLVLAELATRIPLAGANYQWASRLVSPTYGWFVGALGILNLAVGLPGIMLLAASPLLGYVLGNDAPSPRFTLFLALLILTVAYLINVISVQVAARVNNVAFEVAADMSEEAVDAQRSVPRAMIGAVVISAVLGMIVLIGFAIAVPNDTVIAEGGLPGVFQYWIGSGLARTFVGIVVFSVFALTVVGAAASARLLFAMARDNVLPGSKVLARVNPRTLTPLPALLASYLLCVAVMLYGYNSGNAFGTLVGATALAPYIVYLLTVLAYGAKRRRLETLPGAFNLGRFAVPVFAAAMVWLVAAVLALSLPETFHQAVYYVVGGLVLATLWWVFVLRARFANGTAGTTMVRDGSDRHTTAG